jgi:hypothetical protein
MKEGTISVYNEGVTWLVGLSAAAVGGAFLHYDALSGAPWYAKALFVAASLLFLATVYFGVHYAFWLYRMSNQRERREELREQLRTETIAKEEYEKELAAINKQIAEAADEIGKHHRHVLWSFGCGIIYAALLLVLGVFGASAQAGHGGPPTNPPKAGSGEVVVRFSDPIEKGIVERLKDGGTSPGSPNSRTAWIILVIIGIVAAAALIWRVAEDNPEATPLTVAITLFGAVIGFLAKLAAEKPILPLHLRWWLVVAFLIFAVSGLLLIGRALLAFRDGALELPESALLVYGFSAILLALVPGLLFHEDAPAPEKKPCPQCPSPVVMRGEISVLPLISVNNLGDSDSDKNIDPQQIQKLTTDAIARGARKDDILLLLGSADCIPTRPGGKWESNEALAKARAEWVESSLQGDPALSGIRIESGPLPQHARCGKTTEVRAVYPFLIHAEETQVAAPANR